MSFDQDQTEQANISGADLAIMVAEVKSLQETQAELLGALKNVTMELTQLHSHHYPACGGGCPSDTYIDRARRLIAEVEA